MIRRCTDQNRADYPHYGGRGIKVCRRWRKFENFLADMGEQPPGKTIERVKNDKGYSRSNCRWATRFEQGANSRRVRLVMINGIKMPISHACRALGIPPGRIYQRIHKGKSPQEAIES